MTAKCTRIATLVVWLGARSALAQPAEPPQNTGDIVESIVDVPPAPPPPAAATASDEERSNVSGWTRESLEWYLEDDGLDRSDPEDVSRVPRDRAHVRTQLFIRSAYQHGRSFEAVASGLLDLTVFVEGSGRDLGPFGLGTQGTAESLTAQLMELYVGLYSPSFDLRVGQQRIAWGRADLISPNDVLNARDLRDPFLAEPELTHLPTPSLRGDAYFGPVTLQAVVSPVFVSDRSTLYGRNWSALQPDAPQRFRGLFHLLGTVFDSSLQERVGSVLQQTRYPNRDGEGLAAGLKASLSAAGMDLSLYYHYGYDGTPYVWLDPALSDLLRTADFTRQGLADLAPLLRGLSEGLEPIFAEFVRRHHVGFDFATIAGPIAVRLDAAYQTARVFYRRDLMSVSSPAALAVASFEYQTGSLDRVLILELAYQRIFDPGDAPLLIYEQDSYGATGVLRWPLLGDLVCELTGMVWLSPRMYVAKPALILELGELSIKAGGLVLNGVDGSLGWYFRHNAAAFLQVKYAF